MKILSMLFGAIAIGAVILIAILLLWSLLWLFIWITGYLLGIVGLAKVSQFLRDTAVSNSQRIITTLWRVKHVKN